MSTIKANNSDSKPNDREQVVPLQTQIAQLKAEAERLIKAGNSLQTQLSNLDLIINKLKKETNK